MRIILHHCTICSMLIIFIVVIEVKVNLVKIDHVHIYVHDLDKAERWYNDVLGFSRDECCCSGLSKVALWF